MAESNLTNAVYEELGLRTVIHAAGTITSYGGSSFIGLPPPRITTKSTEPKRADEGFVTRSVSN